MLLDSLDRLDSLDSLNITQELQKLYYHLQSTIQCLKRVSNLKIYGIVMKKELLWCSEASKEAGSHTKNKIAIGNSPRQYPRRLERQLRRPRRLLRYLHGGYGDYEAETGSTACYKA